MKAFIVPDSMKMFVLPAYIVLSEDGVIESVATSSIVAETLEDAILEHEGLYGWDGVRITHRGADEYIVYVEKNKEDGLALLAIDEDEDRYYRVTARGDLRDEDYLNPEKLAAVAHATAQQILAKRQGVGCEI
jgi:hypothetical protein